MGGGGGGGGGVCGLGELGKKFLTKNPFFIFGGGGGEGYFFL